MTTVTELLGKILGGRPMKWQIETCNGKSYFRSYSGRVELDEADNEAIALCLRAGHNPALLGGKPSEVEGLCNDYIWQDYK